MSNAPQIAEVAALVGDPARANMLVALLGGRALTATELAYIAGVSPQTTSGHLGKLSAARLVNLMKQGRHRYYRLAGPHVAHMLESITTSQLTGRLIPRNPIDAAIAPRCGQKSPVAVYLLARGRGGRVACLSAQLPNMPPKPGSCGTVARNAVRWRG